MTIDEGIQRYLRDHNKIEGWFQPLDMTIFLAINQVQKNASVMGDICEVGVWKGKSLTLLKLLSSREENIFGFDLFVKDCLKETEQSLKEFANIEGLGTANLIKVDSSSFTVDLLKQKFSRPLRFLHIDAGHEYDEVLHTLYTFAPFVSNRGVIVMDDYQDRDFPGIEAAVHKFAEHRSPRRFVPFVAGGNKMLLCEQGLAKQYQLTLITLPQLQNKCLLSRIEDYFVIIANSKLPMKNEQIISILSQDLIPYEYELDTKFLARRAKLFGQAQTLFQHNVPDANND